MAKSWADSRGPILATDIDLQKAEAINALLVHPIAVLPKEQGDHIRPFAIGLFEEIRDLMNSDVTITKLRRSVAAFVHSKRYYYASAQPDSMRHDIHGNPVETISPGDRAVAQQRFLALKGKGVEAQPEPQASSHPVSSVSKTAQIRSALFGRKSPDANSR